MLKKIMYMVFLGLGVVVVVLTSLNYSGLCFKEKRWLSKSEMVNIAINAANNRDKVAMAFNGNQIKNVTRIPYPSLQAFHEKNPDCCIFFKSGYGEEKNDYYDPTTFFDRLLGGYGGSVNLSYIERYYDEQHIPQKRKVIWHYALSNCGHIL